MTIESHTNLAHMKREVSLILILLVLLITIACDKQVYTEEVMSNIYGVEEIELKENYLIPQVYKDSQFDDTSRSYYFNVDTLLRFVGYEKPLTGYSKVLRSYYCAIDWRITSINVTTLIDFDSNHPRESSINDLLTVGYWYKKDFITRSIIDINQNGLMLTDFYPNDVDAPNSELIINFHGDRFIKLPKCEIHIQDAFGHDYEIINSKESSNVSEN